MQQVYRKTSDTLVAEKRIKQYIMIKPLPLEKKIGEKLFNALLKEVPKDKKDFYEKNGIPYRHEVGGSFVEYTLRIK